MRIVYSSHFSISGEGKLPDQERDLSQIICLLASRQTLYSADLLIYKSTVEGPCYHLLLKDFCASAPTELVPIDRCAGLSQGPYQMREGWFVHLPAPCSETAI